MFLILVAAAWGRRGGAQTPRVAVGYAPLANLTYQVDCVSGVPVFCSAAAYRALWARERPFGTTVLRHGTRSRRTGRAVN